MTGEQAALLAWGDAARRELPWRSTRDPWAVLVSEVMLQQTQVARVVPKWIDFLQRWPTAVSIADARLGDLLELWSGLGYPRRVRALQEAGRMVAAQYDGVFPDDLTQLLALPGIGPYTARAVLTFAFEQDVGVVDTNIARVLARRAGGRLSAREAQEAADSFVPIGQSWAHNQSLMDLGASLCRPVPACDSCPLAATCEWALAGWSDPDPAVGSAGVSGRQSKFEGSDRQGRGRLLRAVSSGPVHLVDLAAVMGWPDDHERAERVAMSLVAEGFLIIVEDQLILAD